MKTLTVEDFKKTHYTHPCGNFNSLSNPTFLELMERFSDGIIYANTEGDPNYEMDEVETELYDLSFNIINFEKLTHEDVKRYVTELNIDEDIFSDMFDINTSHIPFNREYYIKDGTTYAQALIAFFLETASHLRVETMKEKIHTSNPDIHTNTFCESE